MSKKSEKVVVFVSNSNIPYNIPKHIFDQYAVRDDILHLTVGVDHIEHSRPWAGWVDDGYTTIANLKPNGDLHIGWSLCSPDDQFCRRTGREIAARRLKESPVIIKDARPIEKPDGVLMTLYKAVAKGDETLPTALRRLSRENQAKASQ